MEGDLGTGAHFASMECAQIWRSMQHLGEARTRSSQALAVSHWTKGTGGRRKRYFKST